MTIATLRGRFHSPASFLSLSQGKTWVGLCKRPYCLEQQKQGLEIMSLKKKATIEAPHATFEGYGPWGPCVMHVLKTYKRRAAN